MEPKVIWPLLSVEKETGYFCSVLANVVVPVEKDSFPCQPPKNETACQEGCDWGTPKQRAEAPKQHPVPWDEGKDARPRRCQARWPHSSLQSCGVLERTVALVEQLLVFCRAESIIFLRVAPVPLTASLAEGFIGR